MIKTFQQLLIVCFLAFFACKPAQKTATTPPDVPPVAKPAGDDGILEVVFLQMNDVYEITPSLGDNTGGLARVATIRKELLAKNPNTITVLAGDFISPSVIGALRYEGKRIRGKHMIEALNTLGLDWAVFGNHEFDYDDRADLQARLDESNFTWLAANARLKTPSWTMQFSKTKNGVEEICPDNKVVTLKDADGTTLKLGVFGVLINSGRKPWVEYSDWMEAARKNYDLLKPQTDVVVALTHLEVEEDKKIAAALPGLPLIMGGHEHDNQIYKIGGCTVAKADANARTVYVHTLRCDKNKKTCTVKSELRRVNASIADEPITAATVAKWEKIKTDALTTTGFDPAKKVIDLKQALDCREVVVRHRQTQAGEYITNAMLAASKNKPDCAIVNSGSIRVDDVLSGVLTELDVVRMLPFGGGLIETEMKGSLLKKTLDAGYGNKGNGGYLQLAKVRRDEAGGRWFIGAEALDEAKTYRVAVSDFLLTGSEQNMAFLKAALKPDGKGTDNPDIPMLYKPDPKDKTDLRNDIRLALIAYLRGL
jgi:5'-nucleotidase / UDP-sugar diphosphatase